MNSEQLDSGYFARLDAVRDHWWVRGMQQASRVLLSEVAPPLTVLDAGCGVGTNLGWMSELTGPRPVVGVDVAEAALERCRHRPVRAALARASVARLPFTSASFDVVLLADVLQHLMIEEETAALGELRRVLRPGGRLLVRTNSAFGRAGVAERQDWRLYDRARLEGALTDAGFDVERVTPVNAVHGLWATLTGTLHRKDAPEKHHGLGLPAPASRLKNAFLSTVVRAEVWWLRGGPHRQLPFGHSLYAVARRPERDSSRL